MRTYTVSLNGNSAETSVHRNNELVTLTDLQNFRVQLLKDMKQLLSQASPPKQWLKSCEVKKLLNISSGTLQTLRDNGTLEFHKVGGIIYYQYEDIQKMVGKNSG